MFEGVIETLKTIHGETIVYKGDGSFSHSFTGIFDETYDELDPVSGQMISSQTPSLLLALADIPARPSRGDQFVIRGETYVVHKFEPDGKGAGRIFLSEDD